MPTPISLSLQAVLNAGAGGLYDSFQQSLQNISESLVAAETQTLAVLTTGIQPSFPSITTPGFLILQNLDPTNYILYGPYISSAQKVWGKIMPGHFALCMLDPATVLSFTANTATCALLAKLWNA